MYDKYAYNFDNDRHVEIFTRSFNSIVKRRLDELEHTSLVTEWISYVYEAGYESQSEKKDKNNHQKINKNVILARITGRRVLNNIFVVIISVCCEFYSQEYARIF